MNKMNVLRFKYIDKFGFIDSVDPEDKDTNMYIYINSRVGDYIYVEDKNKYFQISGGIYNPSEIDREIINLKVSDTITIKLVEVDPIGAQFLSDVYRDRFKFMNLTYYNKKHDILDNYDDTIRKNSLNYNDGLLDNLYPFDINYSSNSIGSSAYNACMNNMIDWDLDSFPNYYKNNKTGISYIDLLSPKITFMLFSHYPIISSPDNIFDDMATVSSYLSNNNYNNIVDNSCISVYSKLGEKILLPKSKYLYHDCIYFADFTFATPYNIPYNNVAFSSEEVTQNDHMNINISFNDKKPVILKYSSNRGNDGRFIIKMRIAFYDALSDLSINLGLIPKIQLIFENNNTPILYHYNLSYISNKFTPIINDKPATINNDGIMTKDQVKTLERLNTMLQTEINPETYKLKANETRIELNPNPGDGKVTYSDIKMVVMGNSVLDPNQYQIITDNGKKYLEILFNPLTKDVSTVIHFKMVFHTTKENLDDYPSTNDPNIAASTALTNKLVKKIEELEKKINELGGGA